MLAEDLVLHLTGISLILQKNQQQHIVQKHAKVVNKPKSVSLNFKI